jgi:hypothetical protein
MKCKQVTLAAAIFVLSLAGTSVAQQDAGSRMAHANGEGTLKIGTEQFKVNAVVVKLLDDGTAELTLIADITVFLTGTWVQNAESKTDYDLTFPDASSRGGLDGTGKLTLGPDNSGLRLTVKGKSRATKKPIDLSFVGKSKS